MLLRSILLNPLVLWLLLIINLAGSVYGYYWYHNQLSSTPMHWWPFVPDSPFSTTLFAFSILYILWRVRPSEGLFLWANLANMKYGMWAAIINIHFGLNSNEFDAVNLMLTLSHIGMFFQGFLYLFVVPFNSLALIAVVLWMVTNDALDYLIGIHPYLFLENQFQLAWQSAVVLTIALTLLAILAKRRQHSRLFL